MVPQSLFEKSNALLIDQEPSERMTTAIKLFFANYLKPDELEKLLAKHCDHPGAPQKYEEALPWFQWFASIESFEAMGDVARPLVWSKAVLDEEFGEIFITHFEHQESMESTASKREDEFYDFIWMEEHGMIQVGDLMFSRTVQPCMVGGAKSEPIVMAFPAMTSEKFIEVMDTTLALGGGGVITGICEMRPLNITVADRIGVFGVDTVALYRGHLVEGEPVSIEALLELDHDVYEDFAFEGHPLFGSSIATQEPSTADSGN